MPRDYPTVADVLGMHTVLIQRYGGALGMRDPGALEAAQFRPQTGYYEDIVAEAAALIESLAIHHPFVDGNKRIAFAAAESPERRTLTALFHWPKDGVTRPTRYGNPYKVAEVGSIEKSEKRFTGSMRASPGLRLLSVTAPGCQT